MSSFNDLDQRLQAALAQIADARGYLHTAVDLWDDAGSDLALVLDGSNDPEVHELLSNQHGIREQLGVVAGLLGRCTDTVQQYRQAIGGTDSAPPSPGPVSSPEPDRPHATGPDGSEYPPDAASEVVNLPPRVQSGSGQRTVGQATINDRPVGEIRSGMDAWSQAVSQRLKALGIRLPRYLHAHAEMKLVALMLDAGATRGKIVLNNVPCGSLPGQSPGCHQVLERFLPRGYTLTVQGTTDQGKPFSKTYHGKATP